MTSGASRQIRSDQNRACAVIDDGRMAIESGAGPAGADTLMTPQRW